jgi:uncharacterized protein
MIISIFMNVNTLFNLFQSKNHTFFPMFDKDISNMVRAATLLRDSMLEKNGLDYEYSFKLIQEVEHYGDELTKEINEKLNSTFITPFERKDIHRLTSEIDNVVDSINGISHRLLIFNPSELLPAYTEMTDLILEAANELEKAVKCLNDPISNKRIITKSCKKIKKIEHQADEIYSRAIAQVFQYEEDLKKLLGTSKLLEMFERCVDEEEDISDTIRTIMVKSV